MINIEKSRIEFFKELFEQMPHGKGVEVGTFKGEFSREIVSKWNGNLYMVDVWRPLGQEYIDATLILEVVSIMMLLIMLKALRIGPS